MGPDRWGIVETSAWVKVGGQAGSNPGGVYQDERGVRWYVKIPATEDLARNEVLANRLYILAGAKVPEVTLATRDGRLAVASRIVKGLTVADISAHLVPTTHALIVAHFAADAWLANRDALGADMDNMIVNGLGEVVRIDHGGALKYRAQGSAKPDFGPSVVEFETLRDRARNAVAASVFGAMTKEQLLASIRLVSQIGSEAIRDAVHGIYGDSAGSERLADTLIARRDDLAQRASRLPADH